MKKTEEKKQSKHDDEPVIPFDEAVRRMLAAPPDHKPSKPATKIAKKKTAK